MAKKLLMKLPASGNPATLREVLAGVDEEQARPDELHQAPLLAPRWAPNVMVVSRHMPGIGLSWGHCALVAPEAGEMRMNAWQDEEQKESETNTRRSTQVQGPREEVTPLLLPVCLVYGDLFWVTELLLELSCYF